MRHWKNHNQGLEQCASKLFNNCNIRTLLLRILKNIHGRRNWLPQPQVSHHWYTLTSLLIRQYKHKEAWKDEYCVGPNNPNPPSTYGSSWMGNTHWVWGQVSHMQMSDGWWQTSICLCWVAARQSVLNTKFFCKSILQISLNRVEVVLDIKRGMGYYQSTGIPVLSIISQCSFKSIYGK